MPLATTNHGLTVPTVGASTATWGTEGNLCWTTLDGRMPSLTGLKIDGTTSLPFSGAQAFAVGSAAAPGINFAGDTNTGFYWISADSVGMTLGGVLRTTFATTGITSTGSFSGTTGTFSGAVSCTTLTATGLVLTPLSAAGGAGFRLPHGAAPTSPTNGDLWTTTAAVFARINGATQTILTSAGNAATATALATGRTISLTSDVTATTGSFDGTGNATAVATIAALAVTTGKINTAAVTLAKMADLAQSTIIGRAAAAGTGVPTALTAAQVSTILGLGPQISACVQADISGITVTAQTGSNATIAYAGATGNFAVTFPSALASTAYAVTAGMCRTAGGGDTGNVSIHSRTTSGFSVRVETNGGAALNPSYLAFTIIGPTGLA